MKKLVLLGVVLVIAVVALPYVSPYVWPPTQPMPTPVSWLRASSSLLSTASLATGYGMMTPTQNCQNPDPNNPSNCLDNWGPSCYGQSWRGCASCIGQGIAGFASTFVLPGDMQIPGEVAMAPWVMGVGGFLSTMNCLTPGAA